MNGGGDTLGLSWDSELGFKENDKEGVTCDGVKQGGD